MPSIFSQAPAFHRPTVKPRQWGTLQDMQRAARNWFEDKLGVSAPVLYYPLFENSGSPVNLMSGYQSLLSGTTKWIGSNGIYFPAEADCFTTASTTISLPATFAWSSVKSASDNYGMVAGDATDIYNFIWFNGTQITIRTGGQNLTWTGISPTVKVNYVASILGNLLDNKLFVNRSLATRSADNGAGSSMTINTIGDGYNGAFGFIGELDYFIAASGSWTTEQSLIFNDAPYALIQPVSIPVYFDLGGGGGTTFYQSLTGNMPSSSGALYKQINKNLSGAMPAQSGALATVSVFLQTLSGELPAPTGSIQKTILKTLSGSLGTLSGGLVKLISKGLSGEMPSASGTVAGGWRTTESVSGDMPAASGSLLTELNPIILLTKIIKFIGTSFKKYLG